MVRLIQLSIGLASASVGLAAVTGARLDSRGDTPLYPYDDNTTPYCDYWYDVKSTSTKCTSIPTQWDISLADFLRWNPSLAPDCTGLKIQQSYCVETFGEPTTTTSSSASTTPTTPGNGITTPQPIQPGMVDNCDDFYLVPEDTGCQAIATSHGITLQQFLTWNTEVGDTCGGLWADAYVCVSVIGVDPTTTTASPTATPTKVPNGVTTPVPTQPDIVDNCDAFYLVTSGEGCADIAKKNGISLAQFLTWNLDAGTICGGLWADAYAAYMKRARGSNFSRGQLS
ncbi:hypothetical protein GGR57DRAFT_59444 [Xylariaceae sp. FL1272]|nr:hypothetical protein GGR57DRAFT_59444 [Xylariaceae sp. FL1272]